MAITPVTSNLSDAEGRTSAPQLSPAAPTAHDVVMLLSPDNPRRDWPVLAGVAHLLLGTGAKLTIAAPPNVLEADFVDYMVEIDERLGGAVPIEITDIDQLTGETDIALVTTPPDAFDAVCRYLHASGRAWLPIHTKAATSQVEAIPRQLNSDAGFRSEHVKLLAATGAPDTQRWGDIGSYPTGWNPRADIAAEMVAGGGSLLEIGVGAGYFKSIIEGRVAYEGLDLAPVVPGVQQFNLESDEFPAAHYDCIVALGVLEYVHDLERAVSLITGATDTLVLSYCFAEPGYQEPEFRLGLGWVNGLLEDEFLGMFTSRGFTLDALRDHTSGTGWHQAALRLQR